MESSTKICSYAKTRLVKKIIASIVVLACLFTMSTFPTKAVADPSPQTSVSAILQLHKQISHINAKVQKKAAKKAKTQNSVDKILTTASNLKGTPYLYGGSTPAGFDCSGFTMYCFAKAGVNLSHNAQTQYGQGKHVSKENLKRGDLVFFGSSTGSISHVGIYVGDGKMIHSPYTGASVRVEKISDHGSYVGACRAIK